MNDTLNGWQVPKNLITDTAHKMMSEFSQKRHEQEEIKKESLGRYYQCIMCAREGNFDLYPAEEMLHIKYETTCRGRPRTNYSRYCPYHTKKYKSRRKSK